MRLTRHARSLIVALLILAYVFLQIIDKNGVRDVTPSSLKGAPIPGRGLEPGQGQAEVVVAV